MQLRKLICDIEGCNKEYTEATFGAGMPGWGCIEYFESNTSYKIYLCPEHLNKIKEFTRGL